MLPRNWSLGRGSRTGGGGGIPVVQPGIESLPRLLLPELLPGKGRETPRSIKCHSPDRDPAPGNRERRDSLGLVWFSPLLPVSDPCPYSSPFRVPSHPIPPRPAPAQYISQAHKGGGGISEWVVNIEFKRNGFDECNAMPIFPPRHPRIVGKIRWVIRFIFSSPSHCCSYRRPPLPPVPEVVTVPKEVVVVIVPVL